MNTEAGGKLVELVGGSRPPAMRDVALAAGVSSQTVSRVLSEHPYVNKSTRERVLKVVQELGYRRTNTARALVTGLTKTLGLISLDTDFYSRTAFAHGVDAAAEVAGYAVITATTPSLSVKDVERVVVRLSDQGVDGLILAVPLLEGSQALESLAARLPMVCIDETVLKNVWRLGISQIRAAMIATQHLLDMGHETVWHVSGPVDWADAHTRVSAWESTLRAAGRDVPAVLTGDWTPASGYQAGLKLAANNQVTAVLVASDEMAFGVMKALRQAGRRIPEDVSVIGIDDIPLAAYATPALTTVRQPFGEIGGHAVRRLLGVVNDPTQPHVDEAAPPHLIERESTAPPPG